MRLYTNELAESTLDAALGNISDPSPARNGVDPRYMLGRRDVRNLATAVVDAVFEPFLPTISVYSYWRESKRWFVARLVPAGVESFPGERFTEKPRVEFYDASHANDGRFYRGLGQFVTRYQVDDFMETGGALTLDMGIEAWTLDKLAVLTVKDWLSMMGDAPVTVAA